MRESNDTNGDEIDRHDVIQDARHQQDENTGDKSNEWAQQNWIHGWQRFSPVNGLTGPIRLTDTESIGDPQGLVLD